MYYTTLVLKVNRNSIKNEGKPMKNINDNSQENKNPIQVADRLFLALESLAYDGPMGLQEISSKLDLNKSTAHRILNSLIYMGYVKQDVTTSKYRLSFKIWDIANQLLSKIDVVEIARPYIKDLVNNIEETVHLVQLDGKYCIYLDKVESYSNTIRMASNVGKSIPLYCSGVGKALLANMSNEQIEGIWQQSEITMHTEHTITDFTSFMNEIEEIRACGYALDNEENEKGVRCIAVALTAKTGTPKYAFSVSAPINRMSDERINELSHHVLETKNLLQAYL